MRYDEFINSDSIATRLLNNSVWVLGGNTVFGRGVCGNESISFYLNLMDSSQRSLILVARDILSFTKPKSSCFFCERVIVQSQLFLLTGLTTC